VIEFGFIVWFFPDGDDGEAWVAVTFTKWDGLSEISKNRAIDLVRSAERGESPTPV
jgi:hypothetical protein